MRPKNTTAVRRGMLQLLARAGEPIGQDEIKAAAWIKHHGNVKKLRPNNPSGPPPVKRRRKKQ